MASLCISRAANLFAAKYSQSYRLAASMYCIPIHTEYDNTWTHGFSHTLPSVTTHGHAHMVCILLHTDNCRSDCFPLSDLQRQRSLQAAILASSDPHPLSCYCSLAMTFILLETHTLLALFASMHTLRSFAVQVYLAIHRFT